MAKEQIIVIGAGASGLMAACQLAKQGHQVLVLEARDRIGGRIHTIYNEHGKIELGAEFVHGDLPVTLDLLKEAGIKYSPAGGDFWRYKNGKLIQEEEQVEGWNTLITEMKKLKEDTTLSDFLLQSFSGDQDKELRYEVTRYVSGYDTADPGKVSVFALRKEWLNEDEDAQHRLDEGYQTMIDYLAHEVMENGGKIKLNAPVENIKWEQGKVEVRAKNGDIFLAGSVIVALPLGVLQTGVVKFDPPVIEYTDAFGQIGFGAVIKVICRFKSPFWEDVKEKGFKEMGFVLSEEKVPTWWTQAPKHDNLLTGWLGGDPARLMIDLTDEKILTIALNSLENIFSISQHNLKQELVEWHVANWTADEFTRGSYAYDMVASVNARKLINEPIANTIYFAGEYLYHGPAMGTVEAALTSGKAIADKIISS